MKHRQLLLASLALTGALAAPAQAQSDTQKILERLRSGNTGAAPPPVQMPGQPPVAALQQIPPTGEKGIDTAPLQVAMKKDMGQDRTFGIFPNRVFVAGYNIGATRKVSAEGKARGGFGYRNQGASSKSELIAQGIDEGMLTRIANAAYGDLMFQLKAAGFEVVSVETAKATPGADKLGFGGAPYSATGEDILVTGPLPNGVRNNWPLAKLEIGSFGTPELSLSLESMVVMPNLVFDFGWAKGNRSLAFTATSETGLRFGIDPIRSKMRVSASKRKQFLEGDIIFGLQGEATSDAQFATLSGTDRSDNSDMVAMNAALGLGVRARSKETNYVAIDRTRYEALALAAARGWNAAFVATMKARTGR